MILLASRSPRRQELLARIGVQYRVQPVAVDETPLPGEKPEEYVERVTRAKAQAGSALEPTMPVLAADTAVVLDGKTLGKPRDESHGVEMLLALSNRTHEVMTGVALAHQGEIRYCLSRTTVAFAAISENQARAYWATGEPVDKAGGYAIQGYAALFVRHLEGSYTGVMGLPLYETGELLRQAGLLSF